MASEWDDYKANHKERREDFCALLPFYCPKLAEINFFGAFRQFSRLPSCRRAASIVSCFLFAPISINPVKCCLIKEKLSSKLWRYKKKSRQILLVSCLPVQKRFSCVKQRFNYFTLMTFSIHCNGVIIYLNPARCTHWNHEPKALTLFSFTWPVKLDFIKISICDKIRTTRRKHINASRI